MKKHTVLNILLVVIVLLSSFALQPAMSPIVYATASIRYVEPGGLMSGSCLSWEQACDLQYALGIVSGGDQVWAMKGIYYPGKEPTDTFLLKNSVDLYGGFPTGGGDWDQRDWVSNPTILSGDIDKNDISEGGVITDTAHINGTNSYHVVSSVLLSTSELDGFIITGGNAQGTNQPAGDGAGLYSYNSSITLTDITFSGNMAAYLGGGMATSGGKVELTDVTFWSNKSGYVGGGLFSNSDITLNGVSFYLNQTDKQGGGMINNGFAKLTDTLFSGNISDEEGGGLYNLGENITLTRVTFLGNKAFIGAGIYNRGTAALTEVAFTSNLATWMSGGIHNVRAITLTDTNFYGNQANQEAGGMDNRGDAILNNVSFSTNAGGGLVNLGSATLTNVSFVNNWNISMGGGMWNANGGIAVLYNVTFSGNRSRDGGGMTNNWGSVELTNVTFTGNTANLRGGGLFISDATKLTNVTFSNNKSYDVGGGLYLFDSEISLTNLTFSGNSANLGGGLYNYASSPAITNVTFSGNTATQKGGGIYNADWESNASNPILINTILWGNGPEQIYSDPLSTATVTFSDIQGGWAGTGNIDQNPLLNPLVEYGTFTLIHTLQAGSPAIDKGSTATCPPIDQRGFPRPLDGNGDGIAVCDMGAYEYSTAWLFLPLVRK